MGHWFIVTIDIIVHITIDIIVDITTGIELANAPAPTVHRPRCTGGTATLPSVSDSLPRAAHTAAFRIRR